MLRKSIGRRTLRSWSVWWELFLNSTKTIAPLQSSRLLDAFELEERVLLSATPIPVAPQTADVAPLVPATSSGSSTSPASNPPAATANSTSSAKGTDVVLIDIRLANSGLLAQAVQPDARLFLYDSAHDSSQEVLSRVSDWAETTGSTIASLSIMGQGAAGTFELGTDWISTATLQATAADWQRLGQSLAPGASIDLFGSSVAAQGCDGQKLLDQIAQLTGGDVFASTNLTGHGGSWQLEASSGSSTSSTNGNVESLDYSLLSTYDDSLAGSTSLNSSNNSTPQTDQSANRPADSRSQIVFVDSSLPDIQSLIRNIPSNVEIVFIDSSLDGVDQMAQTLAGRNNVSSISILSHGSDANLYLGTSDLNINSLGTTYANDIAVIRSSLAENAEILLFGCDIAEATDGQAFVNSLAQATGAKVAASTDLTGATSLGGDWTLEYATGLLQDLTLANTLAQTNWDYLLPTDTLQQGVSSYSGAIDTYIDSGATGANNGSATTINASASGSTQGLISFDLSTIPVGSTITSVQLTFTSASSLGLLPSVNLYKMLASWTSAANWNSFGGGGINHNGTDAASSSDASWGALITVGGTATFSSANMATTVQSWVNNPSTNYGWMLQGGGLANASFYSSDSSTASYRPQLSVTYTAPTAPSLDLGASATNYNTSFTQYGSAVKIADPTSSVTAGTNSISPNLSGMTLTISNLLDGSAESLSATTAGTNVTASYNSTTGVLTLSGSDTAAHYQTVLRTVTYDDTSLAPTATSRTINVVATDPYGGNSVTATTTITMIVNHAPTITNGATVTLTGTDENTTSSGTVVSSILTSANWADTDSGAVNGMAVTAVSGNGTWQYSTNGTTWTNFGAVSATNALLLTSTTQVRYIPGDHGPEAASFTFQAWDQTSGTASTNTTPGYANPGSGGATSAYSSQSATASMTITNDAPTITNGASVILTGTDENTTSSGTTVNSILTSANWADVNASALKGLAITSVVGNGTWQYSTNGTTWANFGSVSATNALLITSATQVRYVPGDHGAEAASFTFQAWDQTTGTASTNAIPNYANPGSGGGSTAYSSQSATASMTVTNDAPTITNGASVILTGTDENTTSSGTTVSSILTSANWADVNASALKGLAITNASGNGTWQYSTNGTTWANFGAVSATNALLISSTTQVRYIPGDHGAETASFTFQAWDQTSGAASTNATPSYANPGSGGGSTAYSSQSVTASMAVTNDAPTITNGASVILTGTDENTTSSSTAVSSILTSANWADVNASALKGLSITSVSGNGTWQYSTNGTTWMNFGAVSATNALLLTSTTQVRYIPGAHGPEAASFTFQAWDQTTGTASTNTTPSYANPGSGGGSTAYSSQSATASMTVTNNAPTITNGASVILTGTDENTTSSGTTVGSILSSANWADVNASALKGLAITSVVGNGTWQYSTNGTSWTNFGVVSATNALLLTSVTQVRYIPGDHGVEAASFTFQAWDQTTGTASTNATPSYANPGSGGGSTAYSSQSATASMTVTNDAPTITNGASAILTGTDENTTSSGTTINSILTSANWADVNASALKGLAITNVSGNGTWQYSTNGTTWTNFGSVSATNALLLTSTTQVRYIPGDHGPEAASFAFQAWDQTTGTASTNATPGYANPGSGGGSTAYSSQSATASMTVTNDAPTITNGASVILTGTDENTTSSGTTINSILTSANWADVNASALKGLAITSVSGNGTWQYSTDGTTWANFGGVSATNALLLTSTTQVRYIPGDHGAETASFAFQAWDQTTGTASTNATPGYANPGSGGGSTAYSSQSATASMTVTNDAPTITNGASVILTGTDENTTSSGTTVSSILTSTNWADVNASALKGLAITSVVGNGTWQYSTNGTTWINFGAVSATNALLITSATQVRYTPGDHGAETASFTFRAWDQTTGTASTNTTPGYANPGSGGGSTAYSSQSATASMTVTNDAPTITNGASVILTGTDENTTSSGTAVSSILTSANWADVNTSALKDLAVTSVSGNGTWQYSTNGTTWTNFGSVSATNALLLTSTTQVRYVPGDHGPETASFAFQGWDQTSGTASTNATPGYANPGSGGGSTAYSSQSATASMTVTNDAPTITNGASVILTGTDENTTSSGTTVNSILTSANWADVNAGALKGLAITSVSGNGTWQYSTDGTTWANFGGVSATNALLLTSTTQVRYIPGDHGAETASFAFQAWDQTTGTASTNTTPSYANPGSGGGSTAYSSQSATASMTVTNDAPTITNGATVTLAGTDENTTSSGTTVDSILTSANWADVNASTLKGLAITNASGNGTWQYSTNGTIWANFGAVSATNALLISSTTQVRYVPGDHGAETASFAFQAWDQTTGTASTNPTPSYANPGSGGGSTAYSNQSATASMTVTNDAPTITNGASVILTGTDENTTSSGTTINSILTTANWADVNASALKGLSITSVSGNGTWQYSTDGTTWANFGSVSATNALLLTSTTQVRYVPGDHGPETASFTFRAWDQTTGTASTNAIPNYANPGSGGGSTAYSSQSATASMTVTNDAPTIINGASVILTGTDENTTSSGTTVGSILTSANWADVNASALKGLAITSVSGNGTWQYSTNGTTWANFGSVSATNALLLTSTTQVRYVPGDHGPETASFTFRAWDQTTGTASTNTTPSYANPGSGGGSSAYSSQSATASMTVTNDAPTITNGASVILTGTDENTTSSGTTVGSILTSANWADVNASALKGLAITSVVGNGTWQYSTNGTTWTNFGAVSATNALLLTSATQVRYIPDGKNGETANFTFNAWDQTSGIASTNATPSYTSPGSGGGTSAYSSQSATASMTITSVNDAPTITNGSTVILTGTDQNTTSTSTTVISILTSANWTDVDNGAVSGIAVTGQTGNGTWQYSTNGTTWSNFGSVSTTNALLLTSTTQIHYIPDGLNGETVNISFVAWDQTSGIAATNGTPSYANPGTGGGTSAYSSQSATAMMTVTMVSGSPVTLTGTDEDTTSSGTTVSSILTSASWTGALNGLAIINRTGNGTWQYSTDGTTWATFGNVSANNALLLSSTTQVRYVPDGKNGETATFIFQAWDPTSGTASTNSIASYANPNLIPTDYSSQALLASLNVTSVNDAPTITNGATVILAGTNEDTTSAGTLISSILTSANWADVDNGAISGIAITGQTGNGTWQYSTNGTTWANFGSVSATNALLLTSTTQVRYVPDGKNGESPNFSFVAWDQTNGIASTNATPSYASPGAGGGTSAYSSQAATASMTITSVNDAPTITNGATVILAGTNEDTTSAGTLISSILTSANWADVDNGAISGIAITGQTGNGTWQYSTNGTTWANFGSVSATNALLLTSTTQVRYVPDGKNGESANFSFVAWDQTNGIASTNATPSYASPGAGGGTSAYSSQSATASMTITSVNDAPTISNGATVNIPGTDEDTTSVSTSVNAILTSANWNDVDTGAMKGIAITDKTGNGTWQYSTDGTTWTNFGIVSTTNALLLTSTAEFRYIPDHLHGETATFAFMAWDQTSGVASTSTSPSYTNPAAVGGTTAYSIQSADASIPVVMINNAPTITNGATVLLDSTTTNTTSAGTTIASLLTYVNWSEIGTTTLKGIAVTGTTGNGSWQYSTDGTTWTTLSATSANNALLLTSTTQIRYVPQGYSNETATLLFRAWNQTSGIASANSIPSYADPGVGGGTTAFSPQNDSATAAITVLSKSGVGLIPSPVPTSNPTPISTPDPTTTKVTVTTSSTPTPSPPVPNLASGPSGVTPLPTGQQIAANQESPIDAVSQILLPAESSTEGLRTSQDARRLASLQQSIAQRQSDLAKWRESSERVNDVSSNALNAVVADEGVLWNQLDQFSARLKRQTRLNGQFSSLVLGTSATVSSTLTVGYVLWILRGGTLVGGLVSLVPAWARFDPLPILESAAAIADRDEEDEESLNSLITKSFST